MASKASADRRSAQEREQARQRQQDRLAALHDTLATQVDQLVNGAAWQQWLTFAARFHNYSFRNILLILAQRPDATRVAGYNDWRNLGRYVRKGETGIQILAPVKRRTSTRTAPATDASDAKDVADEPATTQPTPGKPAARPEIVGVRVAYVFDVSQTDGAPLPEQPAPRLLAGQAPTGLWDALAGFAAGRGYALERGGCDGANGFTSFDTKTIRIRADVDGAQAVKTLAHELGHVLLHDHDSRVLVCRGEVEVEAESVAYLVAAVHGLDTSGFSFPYVAGWAQRAGEDPAQVVRATGQRVSAAAHQIIEHTSAPLDDRSPPGSASRNVALRPPRAAPTPDAAGKVPPPPTLSAAPTGPVRGR